MNTVPSGCEVREIYGFPFFEGTPIDGVVNPADDELELEVAIVGIPVSPLELLLALEVLPEDEDEELLELELELELEDEVDVVLVPVFKVGISALATKLNEAVTKSAFASILSCLFLSG